MRVGSHWVSLSAAVASSHPGPVAQNTFRSRKCRRSSQASD
uniref:Secreted protein n=1 Tax=Macrostomum lignano TaxID=282301 RepID=A0A1I8FBS3_9PLAT